MPDSAWEDRWTVYRYLEYPDQVISEPNAEGWSKVDLGKGVTSGWQIKPGNLRSRTPEDYEVNFGPDEEAEAIALCEEFNRYEWQGPLDPDFEARRGRLRKLCPDFGSYFYEGSQAARWPVRPGRYLVRDGGVGWHAESSDELADDLGALKDLLAEEERSIFSVIDLDTGDAVPFTREIAVTVGAPA